MSINLILDEAAETRAPKGDRGREWLVRAIVWLVALEYAAYFEANRIRERLVNLATTGWWLGDPHPDATLQLPWLLLAPFCFLFPVSTADVRRWFPPIADLPEFTWTPHRQFWMTALLVTTVSLTMNWTVSQYPVPTVPEKTFGQLGPYVHDEFSYRFQAETYLAGRWWWPGVARARELFHQMHVLNEDRFASRYFPGTGLWLAPFVAVGVPVGASWFAGAIVTNLAAAIVRKTHGCSAGLLAGLLVALAPGNSVFNNLLLAHGPALVGIMTCFYAFRRLFDTITWRWAAIAGAGLTLAMLSRPLTAASIALPFGVWWFARGISCITNRVPSDRRQWWISTVSMGCPLLIGFALITWQNLSITGNALSTPYSQYNSLYTPRHAFAFRDDEQTARPPENRHLKEYDQWAKSLTWELATTNFETRLKESFAWSLGIIPLGMTAVYFLLNWQTQCRYDQLLFASIVALHLAHLPYWLSGILGYHYVFESGTLWLMLLAGVSVRLIRWAMIQGRLLVPVWIGGMLILCVMVNHLPVAPGTTVPRIATAIRQVTHAAGHYERFQTTVAESEIDLPAVVLVKTTPADLHVEYVRNHPPFDAPVLIGKYRPEVYSDADLKAIFPDRHLYLYDTESGDLNPLMPDANSLRAEDRAEKSP